MKQQLTELQTISVIQQHPQLEQNVKKQEAKFDKRLMLDVSSRTAK